MQPMKAFLAEHPENSYAAQPGNLSWVRRIATLSVAKAQTIEWHTHDSLEILVCHKGAPQYEFESRPPVSVASGCCLIIPPRLRHRIVGGIDGPAMRSSLFLRKTLGRHDERDFFSRADYREITARLHARELCVRQLPFDLAQKAMALPGLIRKGDGNLNFAERMTLRALVVRTVLSAATAEPRDEAGDAKRLVASATAWIEARLNRKFSINELVAYIGYGRTRAFELFKAGTGLSPLEWVTKRRLEVAKRLLSEGRMGIAEIARAVGFQSTAFFTKTFRKHFGSPPRRWTADRPPEQGTVWQKREKNP